MEEKIESLTHDLGPRVLGKCPAVRCVPGTCMRLRT